MYQFFRLMIPVALCLLCTYNSFGQDLATESPAKENSIWKMGEERMKLMRVYPNPATVEMTIEYANADAQPYVLTVMNVAGQVIFRLENLRGNKINLTRSDLKGPGLYLIELKGENVYTGKLLVE